MEILSGRKVINIECPKCHGNEYNEIETGIYACLYC